VKGLFVEVPSPDDQRLSRIQKNVADAFDAVTQDAATLAIPTATLAVSAPMPAGSSVVVFRGGAARVVVLPGAAAQGTNVAAVVWLLNATVNALTVIPSAGDTLNGALTLAVAAGALVTFVSDGVNRWLSK
jgi:hypothetical protein